MLTVLVTGGAGYIGSHICMSLVEKGISVYAIDSYTNSDEKIFNIINNYFDSNKVKYFNIDIREKDAINKVFEHAILNNRKICSVIHLAGLKSVNESIIDPLKYWDFNVRGTINLLKTMQSFDCTNIVFSSTATIYGNDYSFPIKEDLKKNPISVYGSTKLAVEQILNDVYNSRNCEWRIAILRYFNPIGAHPSGLIGESPKSNKNNLFPKLCEVAYGISNNLEIYGNDWPTSDGTAIRDYIHIMDITDAHISVLDFLESGPPQVVELNLGSGEGTSVLQLIKIFEVSNNVKINYKFRKRRKGDAAFLTASIQKAKKVLNWEPLRSKKQMCKDGWNWYLKTLVDKF